MSRQMLASVAEFKGLSASQKEDIIRVCMPMIRRVATRLAKKLGEIDIEDTVNAGLLGLADALDRYSLDYESNFYNFARYKIREAILENLQSHLWCSPYLLKQLRKIEEASQRLEDKLYRRPEEGEIAAELGISRKALSSIRTRLLSAQLLSLDDIASQESRDDVDGDIPAKMPDTKILQTEADPLSLLMAAETSLELAKALARLDSKEQRVIFLYYRKDYNLKEIGRSIGVTESRASQIRLQALRRLKHLLLEERAEHRENKVN